MGKFPVSDDKEKKLLLEMNRLGIKEEDLEEKFILGSGSGGQKVNKTSSCVQLVHKTSGIEIRCQKSRSQGFNRYYARKKLIEKLKEQLENEKSKKQQEIEKIRRQKKKRSKRAKEKMLNEKKKRGNLKNLRKNVKNEN